MIFIITIILLILIIIALFVSLMACAMIDRKEEQERIKKQYEEIENFINNDSIDSDFWDN